MNVQKRNEKDKIILFFFIIVFFSTSSFADGKNNFLSLITRPLLETIVVVIFIIILIVILLTDPNFNFENYLPFIGFLAASTFKILPAVNNITAKFSHIKFISFYITIMVYCICWPCIRFN